MEHQKYYTINEIAAIFDVKRPTVYNWMNSGDLEFVWVGGRRRVTQAALDAFVRPGNHTSQRIEHDPKPMTPVGASM